MWKHFHFLFYFIKFKPQHKHAKWPPSDLTPWTLTLQVGVMQDFFEEKKKKRIRNELNAIIGAKSIVWGSNFVKVEYLRIASAYKKIIKLHKETRVMQMQIWFLFLKLFWLTLRKIVLVIKKNFSHLRLKVEIF